MSFKKCTGIKAVVTGPGAGKTSFCYRCKYGNMPVEFIPGGLNRDCSVDVKTIKKFIVLILLLVRVKMNALYFESYSTPIAI